MMKLPLWSFFSEVAIAAAAKEIESVEVAHYGTRQRSSYTGRTWLVLQNSCGELWTTSDMRRLKDLSI